ncbi:MAG: hypothetical protein AAF531_27040 [Actinomycetota bacterium]
MPRRPTRPKAPTRPWLVRIAVLVVLVTTGCTAAESSDPGSDNTSVAESGQRAGSDDDVSDLDTIETVWTAFVTAAATRSDPDQLVAYAEPEAIAEADRAFFEPRLPQTFYPRITIEGATATIEDCSLFSFPLVESPYIPLTAFAQEVDGTWRIAQLNVWAEDACVPAELATEILTAYERFWDNELTFSNPPDPNHLLIDQTLTGRRLQRKRAVLEWQVENDAVLRGRPTTRPRIVEVQPGLAVVADCQTPDPDSGFYDRITGERRPETPQPAPGQTDLVRTWLELDGGRWKVEFSGVEADANCDTEADDGIPPVGRTAARDEEP